MSELVKLLVEELVTDKDAVKIDQTRSGEYEVIKIIVAEEDKGRIIGKNGKIAKSIRALEVYHNDTILKRAAKDFYTFFWFIFSFYFNSKKQKEF